MPAPLHVRVRTEQRDEAVATLGDVFPTLRLRIDRNRRDGGYLLRHSADGDRRISQQRVDLTVGSRAVGDLTGQIVLAQTRSGAFRLQHGREEVDTTRPFLYPVDGFSAEWEAASVELTVLDAAIVESAARVLSGEEHHRLRFAAWSPPDVVLGRYWSGVQAHVGRLLRDEELAADPLLRGETMRLAARAALLVFPNSALDARGGHVEARPSTVDAAVAYLEANLVADIGTEDVAEAVGVPARSLGAAFRSHFDCTPMQFLRGLRLQRVRGDLEAADPLGSDAVATVARRWGFAHAGRFAAEYRRRFGESPSATLRRWP